MAAAPIIAPIVEQHAEDAADLWQQRGRLLDRPHLRPADIATHDARLVAHLDGLRHAGAAGLGLLGEVYSLGRPGEVFVSALLALERGDPVALEAATVAGTASLALSRGLAAALAWSPPGRAAPIRQELCRSREPMRRRVGIAAAACVRQHPGTALAAALGDPDVLLRRRALKAAGELGELAATPALRKAVADPDPGCRAAAAVALALVTGEPAATGHLQEVAFSDAPERRLALEVALRRMEPGVAHRWLGFLDAAPGAERLVVQATGFLGDPVRVPRLLEALDDPERAKLAGEAFELITGVDLTRDDLRNPPTSRDPEDLEDAVDDTEDTDAALDRDRIDADGDLETPDPEKVRRWWQANKGRFRPGTRYLLGEPITPDSAARALALGRQRQRFGAAVERMRLAPQLGWANLRARG